MSGEIRTEDCKELESFLFVDDEISIKAFLLFDLLELSFFEQSSQKLE